MGCREGWGGKISVRSTCNKEVMLRLPPGEARETSPRLSSWSLPSVDRYSKIQEPDRS